MQIWELRGDLNASWLNGWRSYFSAELLEHTHTHDHVPARERRERQKHSRLFYANNNPPLSLSFPSSEWTACQDSVEVFVQCVPQIFDVGHSRFLLGYTSPHAIHEVKQRLALQVLGWQTHEHGWVLPRSLCPVFSDQGLTFHTSSDFSSGRVIKWQDVHSRPIFFSAIKWYCSRLIISRFALIRKQIDTNTTGSRKKSGRVLGGSRAMSS